MKTINQPLDELLRDHKTANHWAADNIFFRIETIFLHHLLDNHIADCSEKEHLKKLRQVKMDLRQLEAHEKHVDGILQLQLKHLAEMLDGDRINANIYLPSTHLQLEKLMDGLTLEYRAFKQVLYALLNEKM
jgi:hypothetical protein